MCDRDLLFGALSANGLRFCENRGHAFVERLRDVFSRGRRSFEEDEAVLGCEFLSFFSWDCPLGCKVELVTEEDENTLWRREVSDVADPVFDLLEGITVGYVINDDRARGISVVTAGDRAEDFLASGIPDLNLNVLAVDLNHFDRKGHANGDVMDRLEAFLVKAKEKTRLSDR